MDFQDQDGRTAQSLAEGNGHEAVMKLLKESKDKGRSDAAAAG